MTASPYPWLIAYQTASSTWQLRSPSAAGASAMTLVAREPAPAVYAQELPHHHDPHALPDVGAAIALAAWTTFACLKRHDAFFFTGSFKRS